MSETIDKSKRPDDFYEVLPDIVNELGDEILSASFTSNNGIRIQIFNADEDNWNVFDLEPDQAEAIGQALVRWAQRERADRTMNWRDMFEDYPGWRDGGKIEVRTADGTVSTGSIDYTNMTPGPDEYPIWILTLDNGTQVDMFDFEEWRKPPL